MTNKLEEVNMKVLFGASGVPSSLTRVNGDISEAGEYINFDTNNRYNLYQQLYTVSPYIYTSFQKLGLTLVKDFRFEGKKGLIKDFENWAEDIDLSDKLQTMVRLLLLNGTYVAIYTDLEPKTFTFEPLLQSQVTLLPDSAGMNSVENLDKVLMPPITVAFVNEKDGNDVEPYSRDSLFILTNGARDKVQKDICGRYTWGIYGISLIESVTQTIFDYLNLNTGYSNFIRRYGVGRYFIDYSLLSTMISEGELSVDEALEIMENLATAHGEIKENEDIVGLGFNIKELGVGSGSSVDVVGYKDSLENDIALGLMQSPASIGKTAGSTYASVYVSEDERVLSLEGIQKKIATALNSESGIIAKRLVAMDRKPDDIKIVFGELSKPKTTAQDYYNGMLAGIISPEEYRVYIGLPEKSETSIKIKQVKETTTNSKTTEKELVDRTPDLYPQYPSD